MSSKLQSSLAPIPSRQEKRKLWGLFVLLLYNDYMSVDYAKATNLANSIILEYKISEPVIPIYQIAESKGVSIKTINMPKALDRVSGFFDPTKKIIYVNAEDSAVRQCFTIAHELGHFILEHDAKEYGVLFRFPEVNGSEDVEKEANCFAANLLVPKVMLKEVMKKYSLKHEDYFLLADIFGVSKEVMKFRLMKV